MLTDSTTVAATTIYDHGGTFYLAVLQTVANETCLHLLWINNKIGPIHCTLLFYLGMQLCTVWGANHVLWSDTRPLLC